MIFKKIDAVLPLTLNDLDRFKILNTSIKKFFNDLNICWVVVPDREYKELKSKIKGDPYRIIKESSLLPELKVYSSIQRFLDKHLIAREIFRKIFRRQLIINGWHVQQLLKIAIAKKVKTDFYLTLDADVICLKEVHYKDLIKNGRAITMTSHSNCHSDWYKWARRVLNIENDGLDYGVTPALFSKDAVIALQQFLDRRVNFFFKLISFFLPKESMFRKCLVSWRAYLLRNLPWTENVLYNTFLAEKELFDTYHFVGGRYALSDYDN